ncbi:MAG TPA: methyltransferase domain-containing protein, partial [Cytophagaceae bacterium]|nr:methyltransferase domain-containing protein [Cytophagaceae bacterium]
MNTEGLSNIEKSNIAHVKHNEKLLIKERDTRLFILRNKDNAEYLINKRTLDILEPFLKNKSTWLTVGDYNGFEAKYLTEHNQEVVASDIATDFLKASQEEGFIHTISQENVEKLSFGDGRFNFTMCREAYHHFPRAYLGAYEMIRVANKAAIIIEPIDVLQKMPLLLWLKNMMDIINPLLINKIWKNRFSFETVGNYVFKISEREVEKMAMGIGLPCIAFKRINVVMENIGEGVRD